MLMYRILNYTILNKYPNRKLSSDYHSLYTGSYHKNINYQLSIQKF